MLKANFTNDDITLTSNCKYYLCDVNLIIVSQKKIKIIFKPTSKSNLGPKFTYSLQRKKMPVKHN